MANKTIYIRNERIWTRARQAAAVRKISLSALIETLLAQFLAPPLPLGD